MAFARDRAGLLEAVRQCEATIEQTVGVEDEKSVRKCARAFWELGENLFRLKRFGDAVDPLQAAQSMLAEIASLRWLAAQANVTRATCLLQLNRVEEMLEASEQALTIARSVPETPAAAPDLVVASLHLRLKSLERLGRHDDAYAAAESAVVEIGVGETNFAAGTVVYAFALQGKIARARGDYEDALAKFNKALIRQMTNQTISSAVLEALVGRASLYEEIGNRTAALKGYENVMKLSETAPDSIEPEALEAIVEARAGVERLATKRSSLRRRKPSSA